MDGGTSFHCPISLRYSLGTATLRSTGGVFSRSAVNCRSFKKSQARKEAIRSEYERLSCEEAQVSEIIRAVKEQSDRKQAEYEQQCAALKAKRRNWKSFCLIKEQFSPVIDVFAGSSVPYGLARNEQLESEVNALRAQLVRVRLQQERLLAMRRRTAFILAQQRGTPLMQFRP